MEDKFDDESSKDQVSQPSDSFITELLTSRKNWSRISVGLAYTEPIRIHVLDKMISEHQTMN